MANIYGFRRLLRIHNLTTNCRFCFSSLPISTAPITAVNQLTKLLNRETSNRVYDVGKYPVRRILLKNNFKPERCLSTLSTQLSKESSATNLEDFRSREEQKEAEFQRQQDEQENTSKEETISQQDQLIRLKILEASLPFVTTHGWTKKSLALGAEAAGYASTAHGAFPDGGIELIRYFYAKCNDELLIYLKEQTKNGELNVENPIEFIICATRTRLQMIESYISHWPQALAIMALPQHVPKSLAQLLTMVDDICYYSGDRSVDFNWYMRRVGLAAIFKMTEMFMLQDSSIGHQDSWTFLRHRIKEAAYLQEFMNKSDGLSQNMQKGFASVFVTARNILGIGYSKR